MLHTLFLSSGARVCRVVALLGLCLLGWPLAPMAQEAAATLKSVRGEAQIERAGQRRAARAGDALQASDRLLTGADGYAAISFRDQSSLAVGPRSDVDLSKYSFNPTTHQGEQQVRLRSGSLASISGKIAKASPDAVQFNAGTVTLGVRGTRFVIEARPEPESGSAGHWSDGQRLPLRSGSGLCWQSAQGLGDQRSDCNPDRFVLLPDADGQVGRIVLKQGWRTLTLSTAYATVQAGSSLQEVQTLTEADARARYQGLLDTLPPPARQFVVRFASGSATQLSPESLAVLDQLRAALTQWPVVPDVDVVGHTDTAGDAAQNDALSLQRARTVSTLLQAQLPADRLHVSGRGERQLLVSTPDNTAEALNRRVEITLY